MYDNETVANWAKDTIQGALSPDYDWTVDGDIITRLDETEVVADGALQKTGEDVAGEGTMSGRVDVLISTTKQSAEGAVQDAVALDGSAANYFQMSLSDDITDLSFTGIDHVVGYAQVFILDVTSASHTINWNIGTVAWAYGQEPVLSITGGRDIISLITLDGGSTWTGALSQPDCQ